LLAVAGLSLADERDFARERGKGVGLRVPGMTPFRDAAAAAELGKTL
jgi:hypothetical protein